MMNELLQTAKVTVSQQHSGLQVFGLQWPATPNLVYSTLDEAMSAGTLDVAEVSAEGSVPELRVESRSDVMTFLMAGEREGDIVTHIGKTEVDNEGLVDYQDNLRLPFTSLVPHLAERGAVPMSTEPRTMEMHPVSTSNGSVAPLIAELRSGHPGLRDEAERRVRESDHPRPPSPARPPSDPMIAGLHDEPGPEWWSRPPVERSARSFPRGAWRWGPGLVWTAVLLGGVLLRADDRPASAPAPASDPFAVIRDRPLSAATWPLWREVYLRIFFDDNTDPVQDRMFYEQVRAFFTATVSASGGSLPKPTSATSTSGPSTRIMSPTTRSLRGIICPSSCTPATTGRRQRR
jgi:ARG and Rhodanese-Phosphatase-superfamily-associated Protein domain